MIARQVGETPAANSSRDTPKRQGVRRHIHRARRGSLRRPSRQHRLQSGPRRRARRVSQIGSNAVSDSARSRCADLPPEDRRHEVPVSSCILPVMRPPHLAPRRAINAAASTARAPRVAKVSDDLRVGAMGCSERPPPRRGVAWRRKVPSACRPFTRRTRRRKPPGASRRRSIGTTRRLLPHDSRRQRDQPFLPEHRSLCSSAQVMAVRRRRRREGRRTICSRQVRRLRGRAWGRVCASTTPCTTCAPTSEFTAA